MQCRKCGTEIAEKALICYRCGTATTEAKFKPASTTTRKLPVVWIAAIVVALLVLAAFFLLNSGS